MNYYEYITNLTGKSIDDSDDFSVNHDTDELTYRGIDLMSFTKDLQDGYRMVDTTIIVETIRKFQDKFRRTLGKHGYKGHYRYTYCTKTSHFEPVVSAAASWSDGLEISSTYDVKLILQMYEKGYLEEGTLLIANGIKTDEYLRELVYLHNYTLLEVVTVLDSIEEYEKLTQYDISGMGLGIRIAVEGEDDNFYTSRFGVANGDVMKLGKMISDDGYELAMVHHFMSGGIKDNVNYWVELTKICKTYNELVKLCGKIKYFNLGGGVPYSLDIFNDTRTEFLDELVVHLYDNLHHHPTLVTEFGTLTVSASGCHVFRVVNQKRQNSKELWYNISNSFINCLPDTWGLKSKFVVMPLNHWDKECVKVNLGGLTCDSKDTYTSVQHGEDIYMPEVEVGDDDLFIAFFYTGGYQEEIGGFNGVQHCLIPSLPIITPSEVLKPQQTFDSVKKLLGYD